MPLKIYDWGTLSPISEWKLTANFSPSHDSPANVQINKKADALTGQGMSKEEAVSKVLMENPDLYEAYLRENPEQM